MRVQLWSSGGGVQSSAIAALICMGKLNPDLSVIADTGREASEVWEYMDKFVYPALKNAGVILHRVRKEEFTDIDLYSGKNKDSLVIPAFTDESGSIGKLPTYCSNEWKRRVVRRFADTHFPNAKFNVWIGFTTDELRRCFQEPGKWEPVFPLIKMGLNRQEAIKLVETMGWPAPPRSACWMCPNRTHEQWMHLKNNSPGDFAKAVEFEEQIRAKNDALWLTKSGKPLSELKDREDDLFTGRCDGGQCFV